MNISQDIKDVARESLVVLEVVADKALEKAGHKYSTAENHLASYNAATDTTATSILTKAQNSVTEGYEALAREPAISRVVYCDGVGEEHVLYIARGCIVTTPKDITLASYKTSLGRLAAARVGTEVTITIGNQAPQQLEVLEKVSLKPGMSDKAWDSVESVFFDEGGIKSVGSLRKLLDLSKQDNAGIDLEDSSALDAELAVEDDLIVDGLRRQIHTAMQLRDQPILDEFQDEIFRLPLDSQLVILGPPGTGKTTTLIKRLSQKLNPDFLEEQEQRLVENTDLTVKSHAESWMMFAPTDLLKQYVREAFNREGIPAPATNISTWEKHRDDLARNVLNILQTTDRTGFVIKRNLEFLSTPTMENPIDCYEAFVAFHQARTVEKMTAGLKKLKQTKKYDDSGLNSQISDVIEGVKKGTLLSVFRALLELEGSIYKKSKLLKEESDGLIKKGLVLEFNKDKAFLEELGRFSDSLKVSAAPDDDAQDLDDEEETVSSNLKQRAKQAYNTAIRRLAQSIFTNTKLPKNSKTAQIVKWLGDRLPAESRLVQIGKLNEIRSGLQQYTQATNRYLKTVPGSYRLFRKQSLKSGVWYKKEPKDSRHIDSGELDLLVLATLKTARILMQDSAIKRKLDGAGYELLQLIKSHYRNQILVDEATDFSPLQLAAMENLTSLETQSFFACGDFNQRITSWGTRSAEQLKWVSGKLETRSVKTVYRQSQKLGGFSHALLQSFGGDLENVNDISNSLHYVGVGPALEEGMESRDEVAEWLASRIREVESMVETMPTVAVLVRSEPEVIPMAAALNEYLEDYNLKAVPCTDGQTIGEGTDVRVFNIKHIKGLEFEAVFFPSVDKLAGEQPELFDKYLYVGTTRAATYFGLTCEEGLPEALEPLRDLFVDSWA